MIRLLVFALLLSHMPLTGCAAAKRGNDETTKMLGLKDPPYFVDCIARVGGGYEERTLLRTLIQSPGMQSPDGPLDQDCLTELP